MSHIILPGMVQWGPFPIESIGKRTKIFAGGVDFVDLIMRYPPKK